MSHPKKPAAAASDGEKSQQKQQLGDEDQSQRTLPSVLSPNNISLESSSSVPVTSADDDEESQGDGDADGLEEPLQLPMHRTGLSQFYIGRSRSFTDIPSEVKTVHDLQKSPLSLSEEEEEEEEEDEGGKRTNNNNENIPCRFQVTLLISYMIISYIGLLRSFLFFLSFFVLFLFWCVCDLNYSI